MGGMTGRMTTPLVSGIGLAANENKFSGEQLVEVVQEAIRKNFVYVPHQGEEFDPEAVDQAHWNIIRAVDLNALRIGHGVQATNSVVPSERVKRKLDQYGVQSVLELLAKTGTVVEYCPVSNKLVGTVQNVLQGDTTPVRKMLDAGCRVAMGTDDAGLFGRGPGGLMTEQCRELLESGDVSRKELAEMMAVGFESSVAAPPVVLAEFARQARSWASTDDEVESLAKADVHAHIGGSIPPWVLQEIADRVSIKKPVPPTMQSMVPDLVAFREPYDEYSNFSKACGLSAFSDFIEGIARDAAAHNVKVMVISVTPIKAHPEDKMHEQFWEALMEGRHLARERHGVYVTYVVTFIRFLPEGVAKGYLSSAVYANEKYRDEY